jgi:hypothetical protein
MPGTLAERDAGAVRPLHLEAILDERRLRG